MKLTLDAVAKNPIQYSSVLENINGEKFILRPLDSRDEEMLVNLIENLSSKTKKFYSYDEPAGQIAKEHCEAINKYDKLRFVIEDQKEIIGLFEFSFGIPQGDIDRFAGYGIKLSEETDCRIAPLLRDEYQSQGIGSLVMPLLVDLAKQFDRSRIILWGGVFQDNPQAIRFYEKNGFKKLGQFKNQDGLMTTDMMLLLT